MLQAFFKESAEQSLDAVLGANLERSECQQKGHEEKKNLQSRGVIGIVGA